MHDYGGCLYFAPLSRSRSSFPLSRDPVKTATASYAKRTRSSKQKKPESRLGNGSFRAGVKLKQNKGPQFYQHLIKFNVADRVIDWNNTISLVADYYSGAHRRVSAVN